MLFPTHLYPENKDCTLIWVEYLACAAVMAVAEKIHRTRRVGHPRERIFRWKTSRSFAKDEDTAAKWLKGSANNPFDPLLFPYLTPVCVSAPPSFPLHHLWRRERERGIDAGRIEIEHG